MADFAVMHGMQLAGMFIQHYKVVPLCINGQMMSEWWLHAATMEQDLLFLKIERIDIPETDEEKAWLDKQNFKNTADDAYTGW